MSVENFENTSVYMVGRFTDQVCRQCGNVLRFIHLDLRVLELRTDSTPCGNGAKDIAGGTEFRHLPRDGTGEPDNAFLDR